MKKAINISIGGKLFNIEEDAYQRLDTYLSKVKASFAGLPESEEVTSDFEARAAEHLTNSKLSGDQIITMKEVEALIAVMGEAETLGEENTTTSNTKESSENVGEKRRLYRNTDDAMLAGVCSGLASFFGVDPVWVRLFFIITTIAGGYTIILYIILWIVVPAAKTTTEKMQMAGVSVTVENVRQAVKEEVENLSSEEGKKKLKRFPGRMIAMLMDLCKRLLAIIIPIISTTLGIIIGIGSSIAIVGLLIVLAQAVVNKDSPYIDFPISQVVSGPQYYWILFTMFFLIFIPLVILQIVGTSLLKRKNAFHPVVLAGLIGLWIGAGIIGSVLAVKYGPEIETRINNLPQYQTIRKDFSVTDFTKIKAGHGAKVTIKQGDLYSISATGWQKDIEKLEAVVTDGALSFKRSEDNKICIFCTSSGIKIDITLPTIEGITASNGTWVTSDGELKTDTLEITSSNGSHVELVVTAKKIRGTLMNGSNIEISGAADSEEFEILNSSSLDTPKLVAKQGRFILKNGSSAKVNITQTLTADARNGSSLRYSGSPTVEKIERNGSEVRSQNSTFNTNDDSSPEPWELEFEEIK